MLFIQGFIKFDQGISEKCVGQTFEGRKKERKKEEEEEEEAKPPFLFPWQLQQSLSNRFDLLGLSRFTRCGCCSYQVSSISVRRVTC
jgi:hypothetical protein